MELLLRFTDVLRSYRGDPRDPENAEQPEQLATALNVDTAAMFRNPT